MANSNTRDCTEDSTIEMQAEEKTIRNKLNDLQEYLPLVDDLINDCTQNEQKRTKFRHLRHVLTTDSRPKMTLLLKCEELLIRLKSSWDAQQKEDRTTFRKPAEECIVISSDSEDESGSHNGRLSSKHATTRRDSSREITSIPSTSATSHSNRGNRDKQPSTSSHERNYRRRSDSVECISLDKSGNRSESPGITLESPRSPEVIYEKSTKRICSNFDTPRSPSPPRNEEGQLKSRTEPKLIPHERVSNILSLPMPPDDGDDDVLIENYSKRPTDPRIYRSKTIQQARESLQKLTKKIADVEAARNRSPTMTLLTAENHTMLGNISPVYQGPLRIKDYCHGKASPSEIHTVPFLNKDQSPSSPSNFDDYSPGPSKSPLETHFVDQEPIYSPETLSISTYDDDQMENDELLEQEDSTREVPRPADVPKFNLPQVPSFTEILSNEELEALAISVPAVVAATAATKPTVETSKSSRPPKIDNFIPGRQTINRAPSHLMAAKGKESNVTTKPSNCVGNVSRDPRLKQQPPSASMLVPNNTPVQGSQTPSLPMFSSSPQLATNTPASVLPNITNNSAFNTQTNIAQKIPNITYTQLPSSTPSLALPGNTNVKPSRPLFETYHTQPPVQNKPLWGVSHLPPKPQQPRPLLPFPPTQQPRFLPPSNSNFGYRPNTPRNVDPRIPPVVPDGKTRTGANVPVVGTGGYQGFQQRGYAPHQSYHQTRFQQPPYQHGPHFPHTRFPGGHNTDHSQEQLGTAARTYAEHRAAKELEAKKIAEEQRLAKEAAAKISAQGRNAGNTSNLHKVNKPKAPMIPKPFTKKPLTQLIPPKPLPQHISNPGTSKKKSENKTKVVEKHSTSTKPQSTKSQHSDKKQKDRRSSSEKNNPERRSSTEKSAMECRSSSDAPLEENAVKSLEKVSPLCSLYVEKPAPKIGAGYGIQKFRIPKKPAPPKSKSPSPPRKDTPEQMEESDVEQDDECDNNVEEMHGGDSRDSEISEPPFSSGDNNTCILQPSDTSLSSNETSSTKLQIDKATQESIETYIKKCATGHVEKLLGENAIIPILQSIQNPKKLEKIRKLIEMESDSDDDVAVTENVKTKLHDTASDSSDDEPLARKVTPKKDPPSLVTTEDAKEKVSMEMVQNVDKTSEDSVIEDTQQESPENDVKVVEEEEEEVTEATMQPAKKAKKPYKKRRNEWDMLCIDVNEMFIRDDVLKATGARNVKPVKYNSSPESDKNNIKEKSSVEDGSKNDKHERCEVKREELPKAYVRLEKQDLTSLLAPPQADDENSMDRSLTPSSDKSSSVRNTARRGKFRHGPNIGNRELLTDDHEDDTDVGKSESVTDLNSEHSESVDLEEVISPAIVRKGKNSKKGKRSRKSAWQRGVTTHKKYGKKAASTVDEGIQDLNDPHYYFKMDAVTIRCLVCRYDGKRIVDHYVNQHPDMEVLISRISISEFEQALQQPANVPPPAMVMTCRFCDKEELNVEVFYDHVTEHTGEYRYQCPKCVNYIRSSMKMVQSHIKKLHPDLGYQVPIQLSASPDFVSTFVPGYICGYCRFTQLSRSKVEQHIEKRHRDEKGATCQPGLAEVTEINLAKWSQKHADAMQASFEQNTDGSFLVPKEEMDAEPTDANSRARNPSELPTFTQYSNVPIKEEPQVQPAERNLSENKTSESVTKEIKVERTEGSEETSQPQESMDTDVNNALANMDFDATLSSLEAMLKESPNNPKQLLENIRSKHLDDATVQGENIVPEKKDNPEKEVNPLAEKCISSVLADTGVEPFVVAKSEKPENSVLTEKDHVRTEDATTSESSKQSLFASTILEQSESSLSTDDDDSTGNLVIDFKQPNILKSDLIDKVKSMISMSTEETKTIAGNEKEEVANLPSILPSTECAVANLSSTSKRSAQPTSCEPEIKKYKRNSTDNLKCFACDYHECTIDALIEHIESNHEQDLVGTCNFCYAKIDSRAKGIQHILEKHKLRDKLLARVQDIPEGEPNIDASISLKTSLLRLKPMSQLLAVEIQSTTSNDGSVASTTLSTKAADQPLTVHENEPPNPMVTGSPNSGVFQKFSPGRIVLGPKTTQTFDHVTSKQASESSARMNASTTPMDTTTARPPRLKMAPAPLFAIQIKTPECYSNMLELEKLRHFYKCMGANCDFSTDNKKRLILHFDSHVQLLENHPFDLQNECVEGLRTISTGPMHIKYQSWKLCVYCCKGFDKADVLIQHVDEFHGYCVFQCAHCFYRSACKSNVALHQAQSHPELKPQIYMCADEEPKMDATLPPQETLLGNLVMPYICVQGNCNSQHFNKEIFQTHLTNEHISCNLFKCHVCHCDYLTTQSLLDHYKIHAYHEFQCMICRHGTDTQEDMHRHLYVEHANYTACLLIRSLIGAKSQKNVLQGALRRLEMSNVTVIHVPKDDEDAIDPSYDTFNKCGVSSSVGSTFPRTVSQSDSTSAGTFVSEDTIDNTMSVAQFDGTHEQETLTTLSRTPSETSIASSVPSSCREDESQDPNQDLDGHQLYHCSNKGCNTTYENAEDLTDHLMVCDFTRASSGLSCVHCHRSFRQVPGLIEHLKNIHGPKRFTCGICEDFKVSNTVSMNRHFKSKHKTASLLFNPVEPLKTNLDTDKFVVVIKVATPVKSSTPKKISRLNTFSPSEIDQLPKQPIFQSHVQCSECNFTDRVRTNMIRHLKSHLDEEKEVTKVIPINPMPCLESKERHFDKMTNWAGSSHRNPDGTLKPPPKRRSGSDLSSGELEKLPKFIPESRRYVCGAENCSYLTMTIEMLTLHVRNLHSHESVYKCPHCPDLETFIGTGTIFERGLSHMRMHGDRLYRCSVCNFHHFTKQVLERHLIDKHQEFPESLYVIREPDTPEVEPPLPHSYSGNTWLCSECGTNASTYDEIRLHCKMEHNIKSQYRCFNCPLRSSSVAAMESHITCKHPGERILMHASFYKSDLSDKKFITGVSTVETKGDSIKPLVVQPSTSVPQIPQSLDNIRHIRQILLEEVESPESKYNQKEEKHEKKIEKRRLSKDKESNLIEKFGQLGFPRDNFYVCSICKGYRNKNKQNFRYHLYTEFSFKKYVCGHCDTSASNKTTLLKHVTKIHKVVNNYSTHFSVKKDRPDLEEWIKCVLNHQTEMMVNPKPPEIVNEDPSKPTNLSVSPKKITSSTKTGGKSPSKVHMKSILKPKPVAAPLPEITVEQGPLSVEETTVNSDSDDDKPLIIEEFDDPALPQNEEQPTTNIETPVEVKQKSAKEKKPQIKGGKSKNVGQYECKLCHKKFNMSRGLKMHIKMYHFRMGKYQCAHCEVCMNSDQLLMLHYRSAHPGLSEEFLINTNTKGNELDDSFWEREYGIVKGETCVGDKKCRYCNFTTSMDFSLRKHELKHTTDSHYKCGHCNFGGKYISNVRKHSIQVHPDLELNAIDTVKNKPVPFRAARVKSLKTPEIQVNKEADVSGGISLINDVIEEMTNKNDEKTVKEEVQSTLYRCYYCPLICTKLSDTYNHWAVSHKPAPFRYKASKDAAQSKDVNSGTLMSCKSKGNPLKAKVRSAECTEQEESEQQPVYSRHCAYCKFVGDSIPSIEDHFKQEHACHDLSYSTTFESKPGDANVGPYVYLCTWCDETCESKEKRNMHYTMWHSHLNPQFKAIVNEKYSNNSTKVNPNRKLCVCPECPHKTQTMRNMRTHITNEHVTEYTCPVCLATLPNLEFVGVHLNNEHLRLDSKNLHITKSEEKVDELMSRVKREGMYGDDLEPSGMMPYNVAAANVSNSNNFHSEIPIEAKKRSLDYNLTPNYFETFQSPAKRRLVAKKSTTPRIPKNTARKSFPSVQWISPAVESDSYSSEDDGDSDDDEDEGFSCYVHPTRRQPLPPLTEMAHIRSKMPFGMKTIPVDVAKLSLLVDLEPQVIVDDYYK